jgi:hypothetical protein
MNGRILKIVYICKIILERMIGKVVLSVVDSLICVVLNVGEKHLLYREPVRTTECITL